jgi:hypothetical protein
MVYGFADFETLVSDAEPGDSDFPQPKSSRQPENDAATVMLAPGLDQRGHETFQCDLLFLRFFGSVAS